MSHQLSLPVLHQPHPARAPGSRKVAPVLYIRDLIQYSPCVIFRLIFIISSFVVRLLPPNHVALVTFCAETQHEPCGVACCHLVLSLMDTLLNFNASLAWVALNSRGEKLDVEVNLLKNLPDVGYQVRIIQHGGSNLIISEHASSKMLIHSGGAASDSD